MRRQLASGTRYAALAAAGLLLGLQSGHGPKRALERTTAADVGPGQPAGPQRPRSRAARRRRPRPSC